MEPTIMERINGNRRTVLASLWVFYLLNMLFRDIHEFARPGAIEEFMNLDVAEGLLVASGMVLTLFIAMIVVSHVLPRRSARLMNLIVPLIAFAGMAANPPNDLDDVWFLVVEVIALLAVMAIAWTWRTVDQPGSRSDLSAARAG